LAETQTAFSLRSCVVASVDGAVGYLLPLTERVYRIIHNNSAHSRTQSYDFQVLELNSWLKILS